MDRELQLVCENCDSEFTLVFNDSIGLPSTCPWCGVDDISIEKDSEGE